MIIDLKQYFPKSVYIFRSTDIAVLVRPYFFSLDEIDRNKEHFFVIGLSRRNRVLFLDVTSIGCHRATIVEPMEVFRRAVIHGASSIVIAHNHPSENIQPSNEDILITRKLKEGGRILGIQLIDHVIFSTCEEYYSFADEGSI